jgi:TolB-like protein/Tfp pilus assembly protein PilF
VPDIFLSYNREDQARAKVFAEAFQEQGFDVWWDVGLRTGEAYDQVTENALRAAKAVVVLWSRRSVESRWVRAEATLADRNRTLVPVMIEPCNRPIMFELTHSAELGHWQGDPSDKAWQAFLADVRRFVQKNPPAAMLAEEAAKPMPAATGDRGERPSLAVMPFTNRSGLPEDDAVAYGMVEDIISAISLTSEIRVLASGSTMAWAGRAADLRDVGRDRGVRYVLEGNVRRVGPDLRVTVQLVEASTAAIVWTARFDRPLSELAALQEDLVREVAANLGVQVRFIEFERVLKKPDNLTAYEAIQRATAVYGRLSLDRVPVAVAEAQRALAIAPDYGYAHAMLAMSMGVQFFWTGSENEPQRREGLHHARQAIALEPRDPRVLTSSAFALIYLDEPHEALRHGQRALDLNPNIAELHRSLGNIYLRLGRNDAAVAAFDLSEKLAPGYLTLYVACVRPSQAHFQAGRQEQAMEIMERAYRLNADYTPTLVLRAGLCSLAGRAEDASESVRRLRALEPTTSLDLHAVRMSARGEPAQSEPLIAAFRNVWRETPAP